MRLAWKHPTFNSLKPGPFSFMDDFLPPSSSWGPNSSGTLKPRLWPASLGSVLGTPEAEMPKRACRLRRVLLGQESHFRMDSNEKGSARDLMCFVEPFVSFRAHLACRRKWSPNSVPMDFLTSVSSSRSPFPRVRWWLRGTEPNKSVFIVFCFPER